MKRFEAIKEIMTNITNELVICNLGLPARELFAIKDRVENFYMLGSMGLASSISIGVAIAQPARRVVCLDGDGSVLMNMGSLCTIANINPQNLVLVVIDNGTYGSTGDQATCTSKKTRLDIIARGAGFDSVIVITDQKDIVPTFAKISRGCYFILIKVDPGNAPVENVPLHPKEIKERFMQNLAPS